MSDEERDYYEVLRLRGKGLRRFGSRGHGDLNPRLQVHVPETLSDEQKALYEKLRVTRQ